MCMSVHVAVLTISEQRAVGIMGLRNIAMEPSRIAQCLLIQKKGDKGNMKTPVDPSCRANTHIQGNYRQVSFPSHSLPDVLKELYTCTRYKQNTGINACCARLSPGTEIKHGPQNTSYKPNQKNDKTRQDKTRQQLAW